jgi:cell division protein FtsL
MAKNTRSNLAYQYTEALPQKKERELPKVISGKAAKHGFKLSFKSVMTFLLCISLACVMLVKYAQVTELNAYKASLEKQLSAAVEEQNRLNVAIEERTSLKKVEEYAVGVLGMTDRQAYQIEYVTPSGSDSIQVCKPDTELSAIADGVKKTYHTILSYFKG